MRLILCLLVGVAGAAAGAAEAAEGGRRRCSGRAARERLKAAEKVRDKRTYLLYCCTPTCPPPALVTGTMPAARYRPYHNTWYGLKHGCNCTSVGAVSAACDIRTGQCRCKEHVTGRTCDICQEGYYGLHTGGCRRCRCVGGATCDPDTGHCSCPPGVGGDRCDTCLPGHYGLGPHGCLPCRNCSAGELCDTASGRCVCPARSRGAGCGQCAPGAWRDGTACRQCGCGPGAVAADCDSKTGQCRCRGGWTGRTCSRCSPGHYGPRCRPCGCKPEGTADCDPETGTCPCDDEGRCRCKANVVGEKCSSCRMGTFSLSSSPAGCTECYCFGRSVQCTQAGLTRTVIRSPAVTLHRTRHHHGIHVIRAETPDGPSPVYLELGDGFLGDRVTSYGGSLRYTIQYSGGEPDNRTTMYPLVLLHGNHGLVLEYYQLVPPINGTHRVRLQESLWHVQGTSRSTHASRSALMIALSNVTKILLLVSSKVPGEDHFPIVTVSNISLDTTLQGHSRAPLALGVELCRCPPQYSGHSCESPAEGYWLPEPVVHRRHAGGTIVITLQGGEAVPCRCNGKSSVCDPNTGNCLNCRDGTAGPRCEHCAPGHLSTATGCQPCPCPKRTKNFASACHVRHGEVRCLCRPGYAGDRCELCAEGYYRSGEDCRLCGCDEAGSLDGLCDEGGRCRCEQYATGDKCDRCVAAGTYLDHNRCTPCDACSSTLLEAVQQMTRELSSAPRVSLAAASSAALERLKRSGVRMRDRVLHLEEGLTDMAALNNDVIEDLENGVRSISDETELHKAEALRQEGKALSLNLESMSALEEALAEKARLGTLVEELREFHAERRHTDRPAGREATSEGRALLGIIRHQRLSDYQAGADDVFDSANLQSTTAKERNYRVTDGERRLRGIQLSLERFHARADDVNRMVDAVWDCGDLLASHRADITPRLANITRSRERAITMLMNVTLKPAHEVAQEALGLVDTIAAEMEGWSPQGLLHSIARAEEKEGILYNLIPQYRKKYLQAVEQHVKQLEEKTKHFKSALAGSLSAAGGGRELAESLAAAARQATTATRIASRVRHKVQGAALTERALETRRRSELARDAAVQLANEARATERRATLLSRSAERAWLVLRGLGWAERALGGDRARVEAAEEGARLAGDVLRRLRALLEEVAATARQTQYSLRPRLQALRRHGDWAVGGAQELLWQSRGLGARARELGGALQTAADARERDRAAADRALRPRLDQLRQAAITARHAADTIMISLSSAANGHCSRAYAVTEWSPAATRISVEVSFEKSVADGPLLSVGDELTLSVLEGALTLRWGPGVLTHPARLRRALDDGDHQASAYQIRMERVWDRLELTVDDVVVTNATVSLRGLPRGAPLWLGGRSGLEACVHSLHLDDKRVGLWNFIEQPAEAQCAGCMQRHAARSTGRSDWVWFAGEGYAELRRAAPRIHDPRQFSLRLSFRTRDRDALLFTAKDIHNNRSISLSLRACTVVFVVEYADGGRLELSGGAGDACSGRVVHAQATRLLRGGAERGSLRVDGSETLGSPSPPVKDADALPDLRDARLWVGGRPPGEGRGTGLLGALGGLQVERVGYDLLDTSRRRGVTALEDAPPALRAVRLEAGGYVELSAPALRRRGGLGITFDSLTPSGLVLLRAPTALFAPHEDEEEDRRYLALWLQDGALVLQCDLGRGELRLSTNSSTNYTDERAHALRVHRTHKQLELWVDDELVASAPLNGGALASRPRGLFLGGVPSDAGWGDALNLGEVPPFSGTLSDFIVDSQLVGMETSVRSAGAALGRRHKRSSPVAAVTAVAQLNKPTCTPSSSYTVEAGAVKFGDVPHSHAVLRLAHERGRRATTIQLSLQYRTFRDDGLLLLVPGPKSKPKHYLALMLQSGKLRLVVRGRRRKEATVICGGRPGDWRGAMVRLGAGGRATLQAEGGERRTVRVGRTLLGGRLYVGGAPPRVVLPALPEAMYRVPALVGCMRGVLVDGRTADLGQAARGAGQCFPRVEQAHYFSGDAHATWTGAGSAAGESLNLSMEFRTSASHASLLARRDLLVEIRDGLLVVGGVTHAEWGAFCDDKWHELRVTLEANVLTVAVDAHAHVGTAAHASGVGALHVGGLPEGEEWRGSGHNLRGCVRHLRLWEEEPWASASLLTHNVLMDACPLRN